MMNIIGLVGYHCARIVLEWYKFCWLTLRMNGAEIQGIMMEGNIIIVNMNEP